MRTQKFIIGLILAFSTLMFVTASAQGGYGRGYGFGDGRFHDERMAEYKDQLLLNEKAWADFEKICNDKHAKVKEIILSDKSECDKRLAMYDLRRDTESKVREILTKEQFCKYLEIKHDRRRHHGPNHDGKGKGHRKGDCPRYNPDNE